MGTTAAEFTTTNNKEDKNSDGVSSSELTNMVVMTGVIVGDVVIINLVLLTYCYVRKKLIEKRAKENEQVMSQIEMKPPINVHVTNEDQRIQTVNEFEYDESIEEVFKDLQTEIQKLNSLDEELYHHVGGTSGAGAKSEEKKPTAGDVDLDESRYKTWSQKDVLLCIKLQLMKIVSDKDPERVLTLLKEFARKNVTGKTLEELTQDTKRMNAFTLQFSQQNRDFELWLVIKTAVDEIVSVHVTTNKIRYS